MALFLPLIILADEIPLSAMLVADFLSFLWSAANQAFDELLFPRHASLPGTSIIH